MKFVSNTINYFVIVALQIFSTIFQLNCLETPGHHKCGIDYLKPKRTLTNLIDEQSQRYLTKQEFQPLRIHLDYSFIENNMDKFNNQDFVDLKDKVMPKTKEVFEKLLQVQRIDGKLRFDTRKCDEFTLPEIYSPDGDGVEADLVIFVMLDDTGFFKENGIEAAAIHCLQHGTTRRPVAGYITFRPELDVKNSTSLDYQVWLAVHEITHVLVMNDSLYGDYIDYSLNVLGFDNVVGSKEIRISEEEGKDSSPRINKSSSTHKRKVEEFIKMKRLISENLSVNRKDDGLSAEANNNKYLNQMTYELLEKEAIIRPSPSSINKVNYHIPYRLQSKNKKMIYIKSHDVLNTARRHYNCESVKGVPLEYNGGEGTNGAHWGKRYMNTDYMIGDSYGENLISEITLSLFEDSGWYKTDLNLANLFAWGKNGGCDFIEGGNCADPVKNDAFQSKKPEQFSTKERTAITTKFAKEFCIDSSGPVCSTHNIFRGVCAIRHYKFDLNGFERHYPDPKIGGVDSLADKCPIAIEAKRGQIYYGGSCRVGKQAFKYEKIGPDSACFISTLKISDGSDASARIDFTSFLQKRNEKEKDLEDKEEYQDDGDSDIDTLNRKDIYSKDGKVSACFEFKCQGKNLQVIVNNKAYTCDKDNKASNIEGYSGEIFCPDMEILCNEKFKCKYGCTEYYSTKNGFFNYDY